MDGLADEEGRQEEEEYCEVGTDLYTSQGYEEDHNFTQGNNGSCGERLAQSP